MKKLFTFLTLLVVAAVSAFADTYTADLTGIVTQYGYRDKEASNVEAEVTSTGDNQYTIVLKQAKVAGELLGDLTFEGVTGKTYSDGTVSYSFDGDLSVSNAYGYDGYSDGSTHAATLTGASKDGQLYLDINSSIAFGMGSVSYELIYGTEITVPGDSDDPDDPGSAQTTTTYTDDLKSVIPSYDVNQLEVQNEEADVTSTGDNQYTIVLKKASIVGMLLGDLTFEGVTGKTYSDGTISYSFDGDLSVSNAEGNNGYTNGSTHAATLTGASKDGKLYLDIKTSMAWGYSTLDFELVYGTEITAPDEPDQPDQPDPGSEATTYKDNLTGIVSTYGWNSQEATDVEADVTNTGDDTYTIVLKQAKIVGTGIGDLTFEGVTGKTYSDGTISYSFDGSYSVSNSQGYMGFTNDSKHAGTLTGASKDGKLYLDIKSTLNNGLSDVDFELVYGTEITTPTDPDEPDTPDPGTTAQTVSYTNNASVTYNGTTTEHPDAKIDITTETDGSTTLLFHELTIGDNLIGDYTAKDVVADTLEDGSVQYTFDGTASLSNLGDMAWLFGISDSAPFSFTAVAKDGTLNGKFVTDLSGVEATIIYGTDPTQQGGDEGGDVKTVSYTNNASVTYNGTTTEHPDARIDITTEADGSTTLLFHELTIGSNLIGDYTAKDVTVDTLEDGSVQYTFDGTASLSNLGENAWLFGISDSAPFSFTAVEKDGTLNGKFDTSLAGADATIIYGTDPTEPTKEAVTYTDVAGSSIEDEATPYDEGEATVDVTDNGDGTSTIVWHQLKAKNTAIADITISDVTTTVTSDSTTYAFVGYADASNATSDAETFGVDEDGKLALSLDGTLEDGKLKLTIQFYAPLTDDWKIVTCTFGYVPEATEPDNPDDPSTGINSINADINAGKAEVYTLGGARVKSLQRGVNIVRTADGKTVKIIKK